MMDALSQEQIEENIVGLRKRAAIAGAFYKDLISQELPSDAAAALVGIWLSWDLGEWGEWADE